MVGTQLWPHLDQMSQTALRRTRPSDWASAYFLRANPWVTTACCRSAAQNHLPLLSIRAAHSLRAMSTSEVRPDSTVCPQWAACKMSASGRLAEGRRHPQLAIRVMRTYGMAYWYGMRPLPTCTGLMLSATWPSCRVPHGSLKFAASRFESRCQINTLFGRQQSGATTSK